MTVVRVPPAACPVCGTVCDAAHCFAHPEALPIPGDLTVCIACAAYLVFGADLSGRLMLVELPTDFFERLKPRERQTLENGRRAVLGIPSMRGGWAWGRL